MPPLPKSSRRPSTGKREREAGKGSSSAPPTSSSSRSRTTKADSLREQVARMYMMLGVMIRPFGRFYPVLGPIGENLSELSEDAADAWMDLAQKDKRVLEYLETLTGASTWGNVIGIHIAIFASALPGGEYLSQVTQQNNTEQDPVKAEFYRQGKALGLSDDECEQAYIQAMSGPMPARETDSGGPGDTVRVASPPAHDGSEQAPVTAAPAVGQSRAAIVTPSQLGVTQAGLDGTFPADASAPNGR